MHDLFISQQIAHTVIKKSNEQRASKVIEIKIKVGDLTHLNPEQIDFWLKEFFRHTPAEGAKILIEKIPPSIQCKSCGYQGPVKVENNFLTCSFIPVNCPQCGSDKVKITSGQECLLERIKIKR